MNTIISYFPNLAFLFCLWQHLPSVMLITSTLNMESACRFEFLICIYKLLGVPVEKTKILTPALHHNMHLSSCRDYRIPASHTKNRNTHVSHGKSVSLIKVHRERSPHPMMGGGEKEHQLIRGFLGFARSSFR
jgi:hypothetical protein